MKVNKRLKLEYYPIGEGVSGDNWLIAQLGYDDLVDSNVAITTDNVRASEVMGSVIDYAVLFKEAPKLYEILWNLLEEYIEGDGVINNQTMVEIRDKLLEIDGEIEKIEE